MESFLKHVKEYWPAILAIFSLVVTWTSLLGRVSTVEARVDKIDGKIETMDTTLTKIQVDVSYIRATLDSKL